VRADVYWGPMILDDLFLNDGDDDEKTDVPEGNEEAIAGPEAGFYENSDVPGESEGISNAQQ